MRAGLGIRELLVASRPLSWVNTGLPFLAASFEVTRGLTPLIVLGTLYFLGPYNLLLYGVNDLFDHASDVANPRKGSVEGGLVAPADGRRLWLAIAVTNLPLLVAIALLGGSVLGAALLALTAGVAIVYSAPPLRTKVRPVLDSATSALHFALPAVCGFVLAGLAPHDLPWPLLVGFVAWGMASHALGAIQDIEYDRAAGIGSIATAFGARATAQFAVVGYAVALLVALRIAAPSGSIVAAALAPYLLLPAMVLARSDEPQARRAWRSFLGLNLLAGFVLTQVLLARWGFTQPAPWPTAILAGTVAAGLVLGNTLATWLTTRRHAISGSPDLGQLTVVVPCRDEAANLADSLAALLGQEGVGAPRILVVDDGSTDGSPAVAARLLAPVEARARVVSAPPKPPEWAGKSWAAAHGVREATTPWVLILDADTALQPRALTSLLAEAERRGADLLTGVTRYVMPTPAERLSIPGFALVLFGFVPVWLAAVTRGRLAPFAYGPLELVRRETYLADGGHGALPASAREDIDLARTVARVGGRVAIVHAADLAATRHYRTVPTVADAWSRILPAYAGGSLAILVALLAGEVLAWVLPVALPVVALVADPTWLGAALVPLATLIAARLALAVTQRQPLATVVLHPITAALTIGLHLLALATLVAGRTPVWRGRDLPDVTRRVSGGPAEVVR